MMAEQRYKKTNVHAFIKKNKVLFTKAKDVQIAEMQRSLLLMVSAVGNIINNRNVSFAHSFRIH